MKSGCRGAQVRTIKAGLARRHRWRSQGKEKGGETERGNKVQTRQQTMTIEPTSQVAVEKDFVIDISGDIYCLQGNRPSVFLEGLKSSILDVVCLHCVAAQHSTGWLC